LFRYAEIDLQSGKCFGIASVTGEIQADKLIPISEQMDIKHGDVYTSGVWTRNETIRVDTNIVTDILYTFDLVLGIYVESSRSNRIEPDMTLEQAQSAKKAQLQTMYAQTLAPGFISSASGTAVTYGFAPSDQDNMTQIQSAISAGIETWPVDYGDVHGNVIPLTQAQFTVLETDANRFKWAQVKQLRTLIGQAMAATTNDAVNAVQWVAGAY
jgi:hypothetical protein